MMQGTSRRVWRRVNRGGGGCPAREGSAKDLLRVASRVEEAEEWGGRKKFEVGGSKKKEVRRKKEEKVEQTI